MLRSWTRFPVSFQADLHNTDQQQQDDRADHALMMLAMTPPPITMLTFRQEPAGDERAPTIPTTMLLLRLKPFPDDQSCEPAQDRTDDKKDNKTFRPTTFPPLEMNSGALCPESNPVSTTNAGYERISTTATPLHHGRTVSLPLALLFSSPASL